MEERPGAPALAHDFFALALSAAESRWLRDALARAHVVVDVGAPEDVVRVPARENLELAPRALLALVSGWAEAAGLPFLPIVYGRGSYVLVVRQDRASPESAQARPRAIAIAKRS